MKDTYEDILHLPHPVSPTRPQMPLADRAAQFSPFAALTGHGAAIRETARLTDTRLELDEDYKAALAAKLNQLQEVLSEHPRVAITYFLPDAQKEGGAYVTVTGALKKVDDFARQVVLKDGTRIPIGEILEIESDWLPVFPDAFAPDTR